MHQLWKFIRCIRGWLLVSLSRHILLTRTINAWTLVITDIIVVDFWSVYKAMVDRRVRLSTLSSTFIHESSWFLPIHLICSPLFGYINHTNPGEQGAVGPACVRERDTRHKFIWKECPSNHKTEKWIQLYVRKIHDQK